MLVRVRRRRRYAFGQRGQLRVRLRLCVPGRHAPEHADRRPVERSVAGALEIQRRPHPVVDRECIALGHDADDRRRRASELHGLADHAGMAAEAALPDVVAERPRRGRRLAVHRPRAGAARGVVARRSPGTSMRSFRRPSPAQVRRRRGSGCVRGCGTRRSARSIGRRGASPPGRARCAVRLLRRRCCASRLRRGDRRRGMASAGARNPP